MRSLLYLLLVCVTLWVPTNVHGACFVHDYQTRVLDSADALERVPGICPGTEARGLISGTTQTGPFAFLGTSFPESDFNYTKPFCLAVTASTDPSNTGPLFTIQSGGADPMMSNLTITSSGITYNWGDESATFPGIQYADGNFQQFQLCVSANRLTLYTGPECTQATSVPFNQAGPDFSNGLISVFQPITGDNYNGRVQQYYVTQCSEVSDEQTIANVQCVNLPGNCNQPPQPLRFLLSSLQGPFILPLECTDGSSCVPEGDTVVYQCRVKDITMGGLSTIWRGTAFNCSNIGNMISLIHSQYGMSISQSCSNGALVGEGIGNIGIDYTSQLSVTANSDLNGTVIECVRSPSIVIGSDIILVGVIPSAPGPVVITFSNSGPPSPFTVSWSPPHSPVVGGISGYMFGVTGDCGDCMNMTVSVDTLSETCCGWTADDQTCTFEVRTLTQDCGFTSDAATNSVTLSIPSSPTDVSVQPLYRVDGSIQYVDVGFTGVVAPTLGTSLMSNFSYIVFFAGSSTLLQFTMTTCNTTNYCTLGVNGSKLSPSDTYTVSVVASNILGSGTAAVFPNKVVANIITENIASVVVNVSAATVSCNLLSSYTDTPNAVCTISYGPSTNCDMYMDSSTPTTGSSGDTLTISLSQPLDPNTEYCYTVALSNGGLILAIEGTFRSSCDPGALGGVAVPSSMNGPGMVTVMNGVVNYNGVIPGSTAQLVCNNGYTPRGWYSCLCDGNWSRGTQTCVQVPMNLSCGATVAIAVFVTFILSLTLGIIISLVSVLLYNKCRRGTGQSSSQPPTELKQVGPIYEEPEDFKPDPNTEG